MYIVSPSKIARYFYHGCERYLAYHSVPRHLHKDLGIPKVDYEENPVTLALLESGYKWEQKVLEKLMDRGIIHIAEAKKGQEELHLRTFAVKETIQQLKQILPGHYLYQGTLDTPKSFYDAYNLDPEQVQIADCRPDLIHAMKKEDGTIEFTIIDIKASEALKTSHKIQVALYALILTHFLREHEIPGEVNLEKGGVWTFGKTEPEWFDLSMILPQLEQMLGTDLPQWMQKHPNEAPWHLQYRCEWCNYYEVCRKEAEEKESVSLIPFFSPYARKFLAQEELNVNTLAELKEFLQKPDAKTILSRCASLAGKEKHLLTSVEALINKEVRLFGSTSSTMPVGENIQLIFTLQDEPVYGKIYSAAILRTGNHEPFGTTGTHQFQWVAESIEDCDRIRREFILTVYSLLQQVHNFNQEKEWSQQKSLQCYVFDSYEWTLLKEWLLESLEDAEVAEEALTLLFYFHSEDLISADEHPEQEDGIDSPIVILTEVIRSMFALPLPVAYQLADVVKVLAPKGRAPFPYETHPYFRYRLSNSIRPIAIHDVWQKGKRDRIGWIASELKQRLWATKSVIDGIRDHAKRENGKSLLFAWPKKFQLPRRERFQDPILSKLAFLTRYESVLSYLEIRGSRALSREEKQEKGLAYYIQAIDGTRFSYVPPNPTVQIKEGESWILTEDTEEGEAEQLKFPDYLYRDKFHVGKRFALAYAEIKEISQEPKTGRYTFRLHLPAKGGNFPEIQPGKRYVLHPRFVDFNSDRVIRRLRELDQMKENGLSYIVSPMQKVNNIPLPQKWKKAAEQLVKKYGLTPSQEKAFWHVLESQLTLVWGPPGTGKTHFLAVVVLSLLELYRQINRPFKVLVSGFTHAAIENCLRKIVSLKQEFPLYDEKLNLVKLGENRTHVDSMDTCNVRQLPFFLANHSRCVVGATTYAIEKALKQDSHCRPFDLVILDEGSQIKVAESLLAISRLSLDGRLLIAGDDEQLPPIVKGEYPEAEEGQLLLHRSVFEAIREQDRKTNLVTCQITENFRMNETLCLYPAREIYGVKYSSYNEKVANQRLNLNLNHGVKIPDFEKKVLDPKYPFVLCVVEGIQSGAENPFEARLVARIASALRRTLAVGLSGELYPDHEQGDREFWKKGLFVVSPHHVQIEAIKQELRKRKLREPYFVDTVDKMQGQECEAVIVSYGVSDPEYAMQESEFIYSRNRLNVSITRARAKNIIILSRALFTPMVEVLENSTVSRGLSFMLGLERFAREGERFEFVSKKDPGVRVIVYRRA